MHKMVWDQVGSRKYEIGVDRGVLYADTPDGFTNGVPWNGLTGVDTDSGDSDMTPLYSGDVLVDLVSSYDELSGTITAYTYPEEFEPCLGSVEVLSGIFLRQQDKTRFGLSYRSMIGNDVNGELGYKLHLIYNCELSNNSRSRSTINDSLELEELNFDFKAIPLVSDEYEPYSEIVIDSTKFSPEFMEQLEDILYGTEETEARLPDLEELVELFYVEEPVPEEWDGYPHNRVYPSASNYPKDDRETVSYTITINSGLTLEPHNSLPFNTIYIEDMEQVPVVPVGSTNISFVYSGIPDYLLALELESTISDDYMEMQTVVTNNSDESITFADRVRIDITVKYMRKKEG